MEVDGAEGGSYADDAVLCAAATSARRQVDTLRSGRTSPACKKPYLRQNIHARRHNPPTWRSRARRRIAARRHRTRSYSVTSLILERPWMKVVAALPRATSYPKLRRARATGPSSKTHVRSPAARQQLTEAGGQTGAARRLNHGHYRERDHPGVRGQTGYGVALGGATGWKGACSA